MRDSEETGRARSEQTATAPRTRRAYEKPGFLSSVAFERQALGCAMVNQSCGQLFCCNNAS